MTTNKLEETGTVIKQGGDMSRGTTFVMADVPPRLTATKIEWSFEEPQDKSIYEIKVTDWKHYE